MSTAVLVNRLTTDEYLKLERDVEQRHEYLDGELRAMAGGSRAHNLLATRVARLLGNHLEGSPCRIFQSDMKVRVERANRFYYPDILVCCNPLEADADDYFETAPKLIVEVLSPKTAATDDGEKRINYQTLDSLAEYLLPDPKTHAAILYRRNGAFRTRSRPHPEDELELLSIGFRRGLAAFLGPFLDVGSRMITRNFFEQVRLVSVSFLECPEGCFVAQVFLRDVVIIQVDESSPPQGVGYQSDGSLFSRRKRRGI